MNIKDLENKIKEAFGRIPKSERQRNILLLRYEMRILEMLEKLKGRFPEYTPALAGR